MSEELDNQEAVEAEPAAPRAKRPARRSPRKTTSAAAAKTKAAQAQSGAPEMSNAHPPENVSPSPVQHAEADKRVESGPVSSGSAVEDDVRRQSSEQGESGEATKVVSGALAGDMALGNAEQTLKAPQSDGSQAPPQPQQQQQQHGDRHFRERGRHRGRNRGGDRRTGDNRGGMDNRGADSRGGTDYENRGPRDERTDSEQAEPGSQQNNEQYRDLEFGEGIIEISGKGFGFLRDPKRNFVQTPQDIFVTPEIVRRFNLRDGMWIQGETRRGNRGPQLMRLNKINDDEPTKYQGLRPFEELTTINPNKRIKLETVPERYTTRVMDLMTPLGMGQRGLIVAPPRTGKTTLLHHIADAVTKNHPEMKLIILLVDERPEEVTDFRRSCPGAEIMASSNDSDIKSHTRIAQLAAERAKRMVEAGKHVFILLDSITRTARAFNNATGGGGRTMSGGIDARAMEIPRKIFAAARNTEEAGSLTIVATALIETGSRMDELIFQEFKGTGNMELVLDRKISDQRVYPAVDIFLSGTRREELLLQPWELEKINMIRRGLAGHKPGEAIERLLMFVKKFPTNAQMLKEIPG
ncbi:MAG: transcription termination factor Rho [Verrucomicrobiota bacterium]|nr:transcription termination factor Rho [Verrucomicrobiota bacterium]